METRANYIIVGVITLAVLLASFGFVYWIARFGDTTNSVQLEVRIPGSVTGLSVGSQVLFNGIKVGDVRRLIIDAKNPKGIVAITEVNLDTPVTSSTKATLGFQGLTGQAYIELKGGDPDGENILMKAAETGDLAVIEADPGAVNNLIDRAQSIATSAESVLAGLQGFVNDNRQPLTQTINNAAKFSEALANNSDELDSFLANVGELSKTLQGVSVRLESTLTAAEDLLKSVDRQKIDRILANAEKVSDDLAASSGDVRKVAQSAEVAVRNVSDLAVKAAKTLEGIDKTLAAADADKIRSALANIEEASKTAKTAMEDVAKVTTKVGNRAEEVDQIVVNARDLTSKLNQTVVRVDGVLEKISAFLGSTEGQGPGLVAEAKSTLAAFRKVADTLNAQLGNITDGLAKFTGRGLNNIDALVQDTRRSVSRIEQSITEIEKNPNRLIFGGQGSVPRSDGRNRR
jgi:phospholipid/cholesterol/gamma-HCH transport system substrate-binding protein